MSWIVGIDVGGTFIKGARVSPAGNAEEVREIPTDADRGAEHVVSQIIALARQLVDGAKCLGAGIGMPGIVQRDLDTVQHPPNFPGWSVVQLATRVGRAIGLPVVVDNDANCAAIGEAMHGAGRGVSHFILATLGTGVGGGVVIDGRLYRGETGGAGELGHTTIDMHGPQCKCGSFGCVETYVGNRYFCERVMRALAAHPHSTLHEAIADGRAITPELVARAASDGDVFAQEQLYDAGFALGAGLANAMALFDIHTAILGGGVARAGAPIFDGARNAITRFSQQPMATSFRVIPAALGNTAGIVGAAALFAAERGTPVVTS